MDLDRRDFLRAGIGAGLATMGRAAFAAAGEAPDVCSKAAARRLNGFAPLDVKRISVNVGAARPFKVVHVSDTHIVRAERSDGERKIQLAAARYPEMG